MNRPDNRPIFNPVRLLAKRKIKKIPIQYIKPIEKTNESFKFKPVTNRAVSASI
jgi:hypothetical protein